MRPRRATSTDSGHIGDTARSRLRRTLAVLAALLVTACASVGPRTMERDAPLYTDALGETWKRQMLLNMVKLRYGDAPVFLDVVSLINQYSLEGQVGLNSPAWDRPNGAGPPIGGFAGRWADRPTITYAPVAGEAFTRSLLTPIQPTALFALVQSGWPVEFVFGIAVRSINGIANGTRTPLLRQSADPRFGALMKALGRIQRTSAIDLRIDRHTEGDVAVIMLRERSLEDVADDRAEVRRLLGVEGGETELRLRFGAATEDPGEITMVTRSILEILAEFSFGIEVPPEHVEEGRTQAAPELDGPWVPPSIRVRGGSSDPEDAFVAIEYRDHWFWIDDRDFASKRMLSFLNLLSSLAESGRTPSAPLVTVGAGG